MTRPILTTALLTALLALAAPTLAAPKASKPTTAETQAQRQPENERSEFRRSQNDSPMQLAEHIKAQDLYGLWGSASETNEGSLLNMTFISPNGTGRDLMVFIVNQPQSILKIRQAFTWQFNEKTQTFILRVIDFSTTQDNEAYKQDKAQTGRTRTAKVRILLKDGKPDMLEFTDQASGEKASYFKQDPAKLREALN